MDGWLRKKNIEKTVLNKRRLGGYQQLRIETLMEFWVCCVILLFYFKLFERVLRIPETWQNSKAL